MSRSAPSNAATSDAGPDVSQLEQETLPTSSFPVVRSAMFRTYFDPTAYERMTSHAAEDTSVEICGVLVGIWQRDADGPFVRVGNYIRCDSASKKFAEVTFTHESWSHINSEMDTKYQDQRIVGWYHSHPNFGIFLSDRDLFIQQNFFSGPGQIALVIDPVRKIEGVFEWHNGRAVPTPHFWVGPQIQIAPPGSGATGLPETGMSPVVAAEEFSAVAPVLRATMPGTPWMALIGISLFLLGWMLSGLRNDLDRRALVEGTVAHYGIWKGLRPDLDENLVTIERALETVTVQLKSLSTDHLQLRAKAGGEKKEGEEADELDRIRRDWKKSLEMSGEILLHLRHMEKLYALTPEERQAVKRYIERKIIEISKVSPDAPQSDSSGSDDPREEPPHQNSTPRK